MKLTSEIKPTPTFKQYVSSGEVTIPSVHEVKRVLCNIDWKTVTFFSEDFKLNFKSETKDEYLKTIRAVTKIISKPCKVWLEIESKTVCHLHLNPASDADESFMEFESTDNGWDRKR